MSSRAKSVTPPCFCAAPFRRALRAKRFTLIAAITSWAFDRFQVSGSRFQVNDEYDKTIHGTQDERLLETPHADEFLHTDTWRVFRIMGEFVQGFEDLAHIRNGVSVFGSARTPPGHPEYKAAQETGALLAGAGRTVITGGGPG